MRKYNIAVVGATGLVGSTFLKVLEERDIQVNKLFCFASKKSRGKKIIFRGKDHLVIVLNKKNVKNKKIHFALFSAGSKVSKEYAPIFVHAGAVVIDNSSAFRADESVPLVVPQVNLEEAFKNTGIIANPNCSTIQCMAPLKALHNKFALKSVNYTTFQAVSGSGIKGLKDLEITTGGGKEAFYPHAIFNNCLPHIGSFLENGYTEEEMKMVNETRKILSLPDLPVSATCVRVPIESCHSVQIEAEFEKKPKKEQVFKLLKNFKSIILMDDIKNNVYPLATMAKGKDKIYVGRIRVDLNNQRVVHMFCVADNIRRGAATNAVEILEELIHSISFQGRAH
jgi:aspartate-semialdehyde dehydrogenase